MKKQQEENKWKYWEVEVRVNRQTFKCFSQPSLRLMCVWHKWKKLYVLRPKKQKPWFKLSKPLGIQEEEEEDTGISCVNKLRYAFGISKCAFRFYTNKVYTYIYT